MHIVPGLIYDAEIYGQAYVFTVYGAVPVGDHKAPAVLAVPALIICFAGIVAVFFVGAAHLLPAYEAVAAVPHLKEKHGK